jgi:hypothetical protein
MGCASLPNKANFIIDDSVAETMEKYALTQKDIEKLWTLFARADSEYS